MPRRKKEVEEVVEVAPKQGEVPERCCLSCMHGTDIEEHERAVECRRYPRFIVRSMVDACGEYSKRP